MNKHSPGPWWAKKLHRHSDDRVVYDANERLVANVWVGDGVEGRDNLRLILNATELLAVIRELPNFYCESGINDECCPWCWGAEDCPLLAAQKLLEEIDDDEEESGGD